MKKIFVTGFVTAFFISNGALAAQDKPGVSDLTEPRPPATVTATNVATVVNTKTEKKGGVVDESEEIVLKEPTSASVVNTPTSALPPAKIFDTRLDLEQTMEVMQENFNALKKAKDTAQMKEPLDRLITFASQAHALSEGMLESKRIDFEVGIEQLRIKLAELEASVEDDDIAEAKKILGDIDEHRQKAHEYFGVD